MKRTTTRLVALLMALIMTIGLVPMTALAEDSLATASNEIVVKEYHLMNRNSFQAYFSQQLKEQHPTAWGIVLNGLRIVDKNKASTLRQAEVEVGNIYNVYAGREGSTTEFIQPDEMSHITLYGTYATKSQWWIHSFSVDIPITAFDVLSYPAQATTQAYAEIYFANESPLPDVYDVTFDWGYVPENGKQTFISTVAENTCVEEPFASRENYDFLGWYAPSSNNPFDFETPITEDITLTARWQEKQAPASYTLTIEYHYDNNGTGEAVSADVLTATLDSLVADGVTYKVSAGKIVLTIAESALVENSNGNKHEFNYASFAFPTLSDGSKLINKGQNNNTIIAFDKDNTATTKRLYEKAPAPKNAWFFLRTDGYIPMENGTTSYPGNQYVPAHNSAAGGMRGTILQERVWTDYFGQIKDDMLDSKKLTEAFASVRAAIGTPPSDEAIAKALAATDYNPETHGVIWYVVKVTDAGSTTCPGYHVDGVVYTKSPDGSLPVFLRYFNNTSAADNDLAALSQHGAGTSAIVGNAKPSRAGYDFVGWNTDRDGNGISYAANDTILMDSDKNLYAQWKLKEYNVTYSWTGAPVSVVLPDAAAVKHGASYTVDTSYPAGHKIVADNGTYTFSGWMYKGNAAPATISNITGPIALTGSWSFEKDDEPVVPKATTVSIWHFYVGGSTADDKVLDVDAIAKLPGAGEVPRDHNGISKSFVDGLSTLKYYQDDLAERNVEYRSFTLYAYYDGESTEREIKLDGNGHVDLTNVRDLRIHLNYYQTTYRVIYNPNGGAGDSVAMSYNTAKGYTVLANEGQGNPNFTRANHTFAGWSTDAAGQQMVDVGANRDALPKGQSATYYAQWKLDEHKVTYSWTGAPASAILPGVATVSHGASHTVDTTYPAGHKIVADNGTYTFSGWMHNGNAADATISNITAPVALTGSWSFVADPITHDVTYSWTGAPASAKIPGKVTVDHGMSHTVDTTYPAGHKIVADNGTYTFSGWMHNGNAADATISNITGPVALTGSWSFVADPVVPTTYTVTYQFTGSVPTGAVLPTDATRYQANAQVTLAANPTVPANYTFGGWTLPENVTLTDGKFPMPERDITIIGNWTYTAPSDGGNPTPPSRYTVTINYLEQGTDTVLAEAYVSARLVYGSTYNVSEQAARAIAGYHIASVEGITSGTLRGNVTINVYYTAIVTIPDEEIPTAPGVDTGDTDIPDENVPTAPAPDTGIPDESVPTAPAPEDETIIEGEDTPLGNLPQTGTTASPVNPETTLGLLALSFSLAAAGLTITLSRKKEEEN